MGIDLSAIVEEDRITSSSEPVHAHIIDRGEDTRSAQAIVLEARVLGQPVTALCGYTWVPSRNPENLPICPKCEEIFEFAKDFRGV